MGANTADVGGTRRTRRRVGVHRHRVKVLTERQRLRNLPRECNANIGAVRGYLTIEEAREGEAARGLESPSVSVRVKV